MRFRVNGVIPFTLKLVQFRVHSLDFLIQNLPTSRVTLHFYTPSVESASEAWEIGRSPNLANTRVSPFLVTYRRCKHGGYRARFSVVGQLHSNLK